MQRFCLLLAILLGTSFCAQQAYIGIYILNIASIDMPSGSFEADFLLYIKDENGNNIMDEVPRFVNIGRFQYIQTYPEYYRIHANFYFSVSYENFPLDQQSLLIQVEHNNKTIDQYVYNNLDQYSGLSPSLKTPGWQYGTDSWDYSREEGQYPGGKTFSRFNFLIEMQRPLPKAILKTYLAPVFILITVFCSYSIPVTEGLMTRLSVGTSSLVAAVMYHVNVENPTGFLTRADYFMTQVYVMIVISVMFNVLIIKMWAKGHKAQVGQLASFAERVVWLIAPFTFTFLFLAWYLAIVCIIVPPLLIVLLRELYKRAIIWYNMHYKKENPDASIASESDPDEDDPLSHHNNHDEELKQLSRKNMHDSSKGLDVSVTTNLDQTSIPVDEQMGVKTYYQGPTNIDSDEDFRPSQPGTPSGTRRGGTPRWSDPLSIGAVNGGRFSAPDTPHLISRRAPTGNNDDDGGKV